MTKKQKKKQQKKKKKKKTHTHIQKLTISVMLTVQICSYEAHPQENQ